MHNNSDLQKPGGAIAAAKYAALRIERLPRAVSKHISFLNQISCRLRSGGRAAEVDLPLNDRCPGLQELFNSLASASLTARRVSDRVVEEWNPYSQRVLISDETPPVTTEFERIFTVMSSYMQSFVEWSHEALHILGLEPFFCGHWAIRSPERFVHWNLANEALAFWYCDIVLTPAIRLQVPGAELLYNRCSASNTAFHPAQAFRELGLNDETEILRVYVNAFVGNDSVLSSAQTPYSRALHRQLTEFYRGSQSTLNHWYAILHECEFFDAFYARFCSKAKLPSVCDARIFEEISKNEVTEYIVRLGTEFLPAMRTLTRDRTSAVRLRRRVQTRAYFGWLLRIALRRKRLFSRSKQLATVNFGPELETYLDGLEKTLDALAQKQPLALVEREIVRLDRFYDRTIRRPLMQADVFSKYRFLLFPFFEPTRGLVGIADENTRFSKREMVEIVRLVVGRIDWQHPPPASTTARFVTRLNNFLQSATRPRTKLDVLRKHYNEVIKDDVALRTWSARASDIQPSREQFTELMFEYR